MPKKKRSEMPFRLTFGQTRAIKRAETLKQAVADAKFWLSTGQISVCVDRRLPASGRFERVQCYYRPGAHYGRGRFVPSDAPKRKRYPITGPK